MITKTNDVNF